MADQTFLKAAYFHKNISTLHLRYNFLHLNTILLLQVPFDFHKFAKEIAHTDKIKDVWGKEVRKLAPYGINGGIGAGAETDALPKAAGNNYVQFVSELKNLYGKIELSDKAIRASENNAGAFVNLLIICPFIPLNEITFTDFMVFL